MKIPSKNGAFEIVRYSVIDNYLAICLFFNPLSDTYVTWEYQMNSGFYWGHYYYNEKDAFYDYYSRIISNADLYRLAFIDEEEI